MNQTCINRKFGYLLKMLVVALNRFDLFSTQNLSTASSICWNRLSVDYFPIKNSDFPDRSYLLFNLQTIRRYQIDSCLGQGERFVLSSEGKFTHSHNMSLIYFAAALIQLPLFIYFSGQMELAVSIMKIFQIFSTQYVKHFHAFLLILNYRCNAFDNNSHYSSEFVGAFFLHFKSANVLCQFTIRNSQS